MKGLLCFLLGGLFLITSCGGGGSSSGESGGGTGDYEVRYEVVGSSPQNVDLEFTTSEGTKKLTKWVLPWFSDKYYFPKGKFVSLSAYSYNSTAIGPYVIVQIYVNGLKEREVKLTGNNVRAGASETL